MAKISYEQLVTSVAASNNTTKDNVKKIIKSLFENIAVINANGDDVHLSNAIGTFKSRRTKDSTAKVPGTDKTVLVEAKTVSRFQPSKAFKDAVNSVKK